MELTSLVILVALLQYFWFGTRTGLSRAKYGIEAPATVGNEQWERLYRVQMNTLEQLIIFIPAAWIFGMYLSGTWVVAPGLLFIAGRQLYSYQYISDPATRGGGMTLTGLGNFAMILGGGAGVVMNLFG